MNKSQKLLSDIVVYTKYAKYNPQLKRRETWEEIVMRYETMMKKKYPQLHDEIENNIKLIYKKEVLPSMRMCQFSGIAIEKNEARGYNCSYLPVNDYRAFSETMFLLLSGCGVGYSVQKHHVEQLPEIIRPTKERKYLVSDDITGWADSIKSLLKSYLGYAKSKPRFNFSDIRPKGARLVTAGGKAPGPEPLRRCLHEIELILDRKQNGDKLTTLECHDIQCHIADSVLAGGIRRSAMISLFSADDEEMISCKSGKWYELNSQRGRANNSVNLLRHKASKTFFNKIWKQIELSGFGEPGIYWNQDKEWGTNPCCEIALRPHTFCNLCEVSGANITSIDDFKKRVKCAAFFGTLQAGFTDFHYLRDVWKRNTEKDALIGVGITGICNGDLLNLINKEGSLLPDSTKIVKEENKRIAKITGINKAARTTTIKPSGSTSCVLGTSSGIHAWHSKYYIRNMQCAIGDDLHTFFTKYHPELVKTMEWDSTSAIIHTPQMAPNVAILRENETAIEMIERVNSFNLNWVKEGYNSGQNHNNVSATISIKENEWEDVGEWMWNNKNNYNGLSVLPYDGGQYKDAPFQECTKEEYERLVKIIESNPIDLTKIIEEEDKTNLNDQVACAGGACEINF